MNEVLVKIAPSRLTYSNNSGLSLVCALCGEPIEDWVFAPRIVGRLEHLSLTNCNTEMRYVAVLGEIEECTMRCKCGNYIMINSGLPNGITARVEEAANVVLSIPVTEV